jgi:heparanase 1
MGFRIQLLGMYYLAWFSFVVSESGYDESVKKGTVIIDGSSVIGNIDDDFVCATLDWWPPQKCDYGTCSWGLASLLNLVFLLCFFIFYFFIFCSNFVLKSAR